MFVRQGTAMLPTARSIRRSEHPQHVPCLCNGLLIGPGGELILLIKHRKPSSAFLTLKRSSYALCPEARSWDQPDGTARSTSSSNNNYPHRHHQRLQQHQDALLQNQKRRSLLGFSIRTEHVVEGCIGLAMVLGSVWFGIKTFSGITSRLQSKPHGYEAVLEFPLAAGIAVGTPVLVRGVCAGTIIHVRPSLEKIEATVQVTDSSMYIPRNSIVEVNQSGLASDTIIDIMPIDPVPHPVFGPLDPQCYSEGLIVCNKEAIKGRQGSSLDELIRLTGKMARNAKKRDADELQNAANRLQSTLDNSKSLVDKVEKSMKEVEPFLKEMQDGTKLKDLRELIHTSTETLSELRTSALSVRGGIGSLPLLLDVMKDLESASADVSKLLQDEKTRQNLKQLIEILSRLVNA